MSRSIPAKHSVTVTENERGLLETEGGKLVFTEYRGRQCALLLRGGRLIAASFFDHEKGSMIGAVYIGKVKNIAKNIDACFVEIGEGEICFLPLKKAAAPFLTNRRFDGRLLAGDELLVQVERDAQKNKQASVTANISLSNDYFAIVLGSPRMGFSAKLTKEQKEAAVDFLERNAFLEDGILSRDPQRLLPQAAREGFGAALGKEALEGLPPMGLIVRTRFGELAGQEEMLEHFYGLTEEFFRMVRDGRTRQCFQCLRSAPPAWEAAVQGMASPGEYGEIVTDREELYESLSAYCAAHMPEKHLRFYSEQGLPLYSLYALESKMETALRPKVWLKSGGYLVIEVTEALTVIDVNSGKYETGKDAGEAIRRLNHEAAEEIALQLRLRNLSGIILVDFVNMEGKENGQALLEHLRFLVRHDRVKTTVVDMTPLGLVEITRKKQRSSLAEQFKEG